MNYQFLLICISVDEDLKNCTETFVNKLNNESIKMKYYQSHKNLQKIFFSQNTVYNGDLILIGTQNANMMLYLLFK